MALQSSKNFIERGRGDKRREGKGQGSLVGFQPGGREQGGGAGLLSGFPTSLKFVPHLNISNLLYTEIVGDSFFYSAMLTNFSWLVGWLFWV